MNGIVGFIEEGKRQQASKWDRFFLEQCFHVATLSKDPSTKCGSVIVRPDRTVVSQGYNGFPKQMPDDPEMYANRDEKYDRIVHCEMNALVHARADVRGHTVYTTPSLSCSRCCVHLMQAGLRRFVGPFPFGDFGKRWEPMVKRTRNYLVEAGIEYTEIDTTEADSSKWTVVTHYLP